MRPEQSWRTHLEAVVRTIFAAIVTTCIILGGLTLVYQDQTNREQELATVTLHANLAQACVLSLPVDPETGRDETAVKLCFTQYDIEPPILPDPKP